MDKAVDFYKVLDDFLKNEQWKKLKDKKIVAVEIPETKEMYYVEVLTGDHKLLAINLHIGKEGLIALADAYSQTSRKIDLSQREHYINITFKKGEPYNPLTFDDFEDYGNLEMFCKAKGFQMDAVTTQQVEDIANIFDALGSSPLKNIKKVKGINKKTKILTFMLEKNHWVSRYKKVPLEYPEVKWSGLEVYGLIKKIEQASETWHLTSLYEGAPDANEEAFKKYGKLSYPGGIHLFSSEYEKINHIAFRGEEEMKALKNIVSDSLKRHDVRPLRIVTDLKTVESGLKDFLKALDINITYVPDDPLLEDFVKEYSALRRKERITDNKLEQESMAYFIKAKGYKKEDFKEMPYETFEKLINEYGDIMNQITADLDQVLQGDQKEALLEALEDQSVDDYSHAFIMNALKEALEN